MDIVVKVSSAYVKYLKVLMISVYENNKDTIDDPNDGHITFWCFHNELTKKQENEVNELARVYDQNVNFIFIDVNMFSAFPINALWPKNVYSSILAHEFLPDTVHRVLFMDLDIAVDGSLKKFYNLPFDDNYLIASLEYYDAKDEPEEEFKDFLKITNDKENAALAGTIINTGVTLFNLDKFRADKIDIGYYLDKIKGKNIKYADQGILNYCFYKKTKLLKTCKYNYHITFSAQSWFNNRDNYISNRFIRYTFYPVNAVIYHYCGAIGFKPWYMYFSPGEIDINFELFDLCPEYADYVSIWWKYAKKSPDYQLLWEEQARNKAAYVVLKKAFRGREFTFCNTLFLDSCIIPNYKERNAIKKHDDLNKYIRPGVYGCDSEVSLTLQNLPESFTEQKCFRLTVKAMSSKPFDVSPLIQELEIADNSAKIFRRFRDRVAGWSQWMQIASSVVIDDIVNEIKEKNCELSEKRDVIQSELKLLTSEVDKLKESLSFKIGLAITFIPRKIRDAFKKKK